MFNNLLHKAEIDSTLPASEQKLQQLKRKRKGLSTNYNLAALLILLFIYYIYDARKDETGPIWLFIFLGILIVLAGIIIWYDLKTMKKIDKEIEKIKEENLETAASSSENDPTISNDNLDK
ncbi:MAG: hypothetical protein BKP49_07150 [Treponema sp. CETP13]|nr:MAG: hypothetical protein BKP49_07150 [Treponema sp. CETP13]